MAINYIKVNTDALKTDAEDILNLTKRATTALEEMFDETIMLGSMWEGPAHDSFNNQFASDCNAFWDVCENVKNLAVDMIKAGKTYEQYDNKIEQEIRRLNF